MQDNTIRLWQLAEDGHFSCVAVGHGHTHSVGAVAFSRCVNRRSAAHSVSLVFRLQQTTALCTALVCCTSVTVGVECTTSSLYPLPPYVRAKTSFVVSGAADQTMKMWSMRSLKKTNQEVGFGKEQLCSPAHLCVLCVCVQVRSVFQSSFICYAHTVTTYKECMRSLVYGQHCISTFDTPAHD